MTLSDRVRNTLERMHASDDFIGEMESFLDRKTAWGFESRLNALRRELKHTISYGDQFYTDKTGWQKTTKFKEAWAYLMMRGEI